MFDSNVSLKIFTKKIFQAEETGQQENNLYASIKTWVLIPRSHVNPKTVKRSVRHCSYSKMRWRQENPEAPGQLPGLDSSEQQWDLVSSQVEGKDQQPVLPSDLHICATDHILLQCAHTASISMSLKNEGNFWCASLPSAGHIFRQSRNYDFLLISTIWWINKSEEEKHSSQWKSLQG